MIELSLLRELSLRTPSAAGRPAHLSAASGLLRVAGRLYVIADDELHLGVFDGDDAGELLRMLDGELPPDAATRKKLKPDFEALVLLPAFDGCPHGALFALGSGSKKRRHRGVLLALDRARRPSAAPRLIDLEAWHHALAARVDDLNIEGAAVIDDRLVLLQRGHDGVATNARVDYALAPLLAALTRGDAIEDLAPLAVREVDLGTREGVTLGFTDAAPLPDGRLAFSAVAERTDDSYRDGECVGAMVGVLDRDGPVLHAEPIGPGHKIEGLDATLTVTGLEFLAVTDADDADVPARLLSGCVMGVR